MISESNGHYKMSNITQLVAQQGLDYSIGITPLPSGYPRLPSSKPEHVTTFKATTIICMQRNVLTPKTLPRIRPPNPFNFENLAAKTIYFHPSPFYQKGCIQV